VFIVCPKFPEDPLEADRHTIMISLALGQYLQEAHVQLREGLVHAPYRAMHWINHATVRVRVSALAAATSAVVVLAVMAAS
jgi:hypothetical protein